MINNERDYRNCLSHFATGVSVITTVDLKGKPMGVTINSFTSVSLNPQLVLFNLDKSASIFKVFTNCERFIVNILSEKQVETSRTFTNPLDVEFSTIPHSLINNIPVLEGINAFLECKTFNIFDAGDHSIIIGNVNNYKIVCETAPLLYYRSEYCSIGKILGTKF